MTPKRPPVGSTGQSPQPIPLLRRRYPNLPPRRRSRAHQHPNRLEQRMGRVHRYGQDDDVWAYNLVAINTREGQVLQHVLSKLDTMREQMGTDRVTTSLTSYLKMFRS